MTFVKATKKLSRLRLALIGPSGSGKTFTALRVARGFGGRVGLIDTERGSASKYADRFDFEVLDLESFHPQRYIDAIQEAERAGIDVLVIDSLSHAWSGKDGALEQVDNVARRQKGNSFGAWREVTPLHNALVDAILRSRCHVIATMRAKTEYLVEQGSNGKQSVKKVGLAPVQRDGMEYEFDVVGDMDGASLVVTKTRCPDLSEQILQKPGEPLGQLLRAWLTDGARPATSSREAVSQQTETGAKEAAGDAGPTNGATKSAGCSQPLPALVAFGPHKGKLVSELNDEELAGTIDLAHDKLMEQPKAKWAKAMRENLSLLEQEAERRCRPRNVSSETSAEPTRAVPPERAPRGAKQDETDTPVDGREPGQEG